MRMDRDADGKWTGREALVGRRGVAAGDGGAYARGHIRCNGTWCSVDAGGSGGAGRSRSKKGGTRGGRTDGDRSGVIRRGVVVSAGQGDSDHEVADHPHHPRTNWSGRTGTIFARQRPRNWSGGIGTNFHG